MCDGLVSADGHQVRAHMQNIRRLEHRVAEQPIRRLFDMLRVHNFFERWNTFGRGTVVSIEKQQYVRSQASIIRTRSSPGASCSASMPSRPFSAKSTSMPVASSADVSAKTLRTSSSTISTSCPEDRVGACSCSSMLPLRAPAARLDAVQEERRLVEQALRRARVLHDDRLGVALQLRLLAPRQVLAGVDDHRQRRKRSSSSPSRAARSRSSSAASGRAPCSRSGCSGRARRAPPADEPTPTISTSSSRRSSSTIALALRLVVVDDEQAADVALDERLDLAERLVERLFVDRLLAGTPTAPRAQAALLLSPPETMCTGMWRVRGCVLQLVEHRPAVDAPAGSGRARSRPGRTRARARARCRRAGRRRP